MIYRIFYSCENCSVFRTLVTKASTSREVENLNLPTKCPECGGELRPRRIDKIDFSESVTVIKHEEGVEIRFLDELVIFISPSSIEVYLEDLLESGYSGKVNLRTQLSPRLRVSVALHPLEKSISFFIGKSRKVRV